MRVDSLAAYNYPILLKKEEDEKEVEEEEEKMLLLPLMVSKPKKNLRNPHKKIK